MGTRGGGWKEDDGRRSLVSSIYLTVQESFKWPRNEAREGGTCVGLQGRGRKKDWSLHISTRYLADLMDSAELIRNVAIAGHLHCGKVCPCTRVGLYRVFADDFNSTFLSTRHLLLTVC